MSSFVIALILSIGVATFAWSKLANSTGNASPKNTLIAAGATGLIVFLVAFSILKGLFNI